MPTAEPLVPISIVKARRGVTKKLVIPICLVQVRMYVASKSVDDHSGNLILHPTTSESQLLCTQAEDPLLALRCSVAPSF
jgi:hypothetical protein